jgi:pSer/pThr/pTyr-binding forkhead associated (FHA) protein
VATLAVYRGDQLQRRVELGEAPLRIGRAPENELVLDDGNKGVSRNHAEVRYEQGRYVVVDLNSQNGVWLGDRRIKVNPLPPDVPLTIGPYRLVLESAEPPGQTDGGGTLISAQSRPVEEPIHVFEAGATLPRTPRPIEEGAPAPRKGRLLAILAIGGIVAAILVVVAVSRGGRPDSPTKSTTTTTIPAVRTAEQQFEDLLTRAAQRMAAGDREGAAKLNDEAIAIRPGDARVVEQRAQIERMPDAPPGPTLGQGDSGTAPGVDPPPPPPPQTPGEKSPSSIPESLNVARNKGERLRNWEERRKMAVTHLDDGIKKSAAGDYAAAIDVLRAAQKTSGRADFGYTPDQASNLIAEAQAALDNRATEQRKAAAKALVDEARHTGATDIAEALGLAQKARELDSEAAGLSELIKGLQERARKEGAAALVAAKNFDSFDRSLEALAQFETAVRLLGLLPGGHEDLAYARQRRDELRRPKQ